MRNKKTISTFNKLKKYFTMEGANFQDGVVGGKMNSEAVGQRVKVVS